MRSELRPWHLLALALLAALAAVPRFGTRENPSAELSDSDYYLDMVQVFAGASPEFDPFHTAPGGSGSRHYARPLLALLAAPLARAGMPPAVALSLVSLLSAWTVAVALLGLARGVLGAGPLAWLPPALFLTGFPQVNWGYHILSDSLGYATALLATLAACSYLGGERGEQSRRFGSRAVWALAGIWALQATAFLARETAWFTLVVVLALAAWDRRWRSRPAALAALVAVLLLARLPLMAYVRHFGLEPVSIPFAPAAWVDPGYMLDFLAKSGLAFHLAWPLALAGAWRLRGRSLPPVVLGWSVAAVLYIAAGYAVNSRDGVGYPLRMTYGLFPLVYLLSAMAVAGHPWLVRRPRLVAAILVAANASVSLTAVALDPGTSVVLAPGTGVVEQAPPLS